MWPLCTMAQSRGPLLALLHCLSVQRVVAGGAPRTSTPHAHSAVLGQLKGAGGAQAVNATPCVLHMLPAKQYNLLVLPK
jgi:hypothetical protein